MKRQERGLPLIGIVLTGLLLVGTVGGVLAQEQAGEEPAAPSEPVAEKETEQPVKHVKLYAEEWKWSPREIRVKQGTLIKIEAYSYDSSRRFDLKDYKLKVAMPQDKLVRFEFTADKKGTFKWKCGRPCGNGCAKMVGKLIVE
jgi:heme/copper-type cytochrome/quinol oxidase subunit 2